MLQPPGITSGSNARYISAFDIAKSDPEIIYAARRDVTSSSGPFTNLMWKTNDGGQNWTSISQNFSEAFIWAFVTDIEINPDNSDEVWVCFGYSSNGDKKVYKTSDGGTSWTLLNNNFPASNLPCQSIHYDNINDPNLCIRNLKRRG